MVDVSPPPPTPLERQRRRITVLGVVLVVLAIATVVHYAITTNENSERADCQAQTTNMMLARSEANQHEREALRGIERARIAGADADVMQQRYNEYEAAIRDADAVRAADGNVGQVAERCKSDE